MPSLIKQKVYQHYYQLINTKIELLNHALNDLRESSKNETKSSAGDKYETSRAMLQLEQDKINKQLAEAQFQKAAFVQIDSTIISNTIIKGSLVKTNNAYFFISIALGKAVVDGINIIALSQQSPLGLQLMGLQALDCIEMNGLKYQIQSIE
jgi:transcription elongation GreA/GreB family factor